MMNKKNRVFIYISLFILVIGTIVFFVLNNKSNQNSIILAAEKYMQNKEIPSSDTYILAVKDLNDANLNFKIEKRCLNNSYIIVTKKGDNFYYDLKLVCNNDKLKLNLIAEKKITIEYGEEYIEYGAKAYLNNQDISNKIIINKGNFNSNKVGTYLISYQINVNNLKKEVTREVKVVDTKKPEIYLIGNKTINIILNSKYEEPGFLAEDDYDGIITNKVQTNGSVNFSIEGTYEIIYSVVDSSGNKSQITRTIIVEKPKGKPTLTLKGNYNYILEYPNTFSEPGYLATDTNGVDIANKVKITGKVNSNKLGDYLLTYSVINDHGEFVSTTRIVSVVDYTKPNINLIGDSKIIIEYGHEYIEPGYEATDNYDGNLTENVIVSGSIDTTVLGSQYITYRVSDKSGNSFSIQRTLEVKDTTKPIINVAQNTINIEKGSTYIDLLSGLSATDNRDGNITNKITYTIEPELNLNVIGTYTISYNVKDLENNYAITKTKIINVVDTVSPTISSVNYSTTETTKNNVIVTITANENVTADNGYTCENNICTKEYSGNVVNQIVTLTDIAGNTKTTTINIANIDKTGLTAEVTYDPAVTITNDKVTVTLVASEAIEAIPGWTKISDEEYSKEFTNNVNGTVTITTSYGKTKVISIVITNIDKTAPTISSVNYSTTETTKNNVTVTIIASENVTASNDFTCENNICTKEYSANVTNQIVTLIDIAGNTKTATITISNIDKISPTVSSVNYSTTETTKNNVIVTITVDENVTANNSYSCIANICTKEYSSNVTNQIVTLTDIAGNTKTTTINIANIDKTAPIVSSVVYSTIEPTKNNVIVTITANENVTANNDFSCINNICTKTYSSNTDQIVTLTDIAGNTNTTSTTVTIANIDKTAPTVSSINYSTTNLTMDDVVVTITASENVTANNGFSCVNNVCTKTYNSNANQTITLTDLVGNTSTTTVTISNINKAELTAEVTYNPAVALTNDKVTVTLVASEAIATPSGWTKISEVEYSKDFTDNVNGTVTITTNYSKTKVVSIIITNIDKTAPDQPTVSKTPADEEITTTSVLVTLTFNEQVYNVSSGWTNTSGFIYEKTYSSNTASGGEDVTYEDSLGNQGSINISISNIDTKVKTYLRTTWSTNTYYFWGYKSSISSVIFEDVINIPGSVPTNQKWDVSLNEDGSIMAYVIDDGLGTSTYKLYIQSNNHIYGNPDSTYLFSNFLKLKSITNINLFNTSDVTNMARMFTGSPELITLDLSSFNTSKVTDMQKMFFQCTSLVTLNIGSFNTANVINMQDMFQGCKLTQLDLSSFDTSKVTNMIGMMADLTEINYIDMRNANFNSVTSYGNILAWGAEDFEIVINRASETFINARLTELGINGTVTVTVYDDATLVRSSYDNTSLFWAHKSTITKIFFENVIDIPDGVTSWDVSDETNGKVMAYLDGSYLYIQSNGDIFANTYSDYLFKDFTNLEEINGLNYFNTINATDMEKMFNNCGKLVSLDLSTFNTSKVTMFRDMFANCTSLTALNVSSFNTSLATTMGGMFMNCRSLTALNVSNFITTNVTDMGRTFNDLESVTNINISNMSFDNVTETSYIFSRYSANHITITVKDNAAKSWVETKLSGVNFTYTVLIAE